jgi:hypothetical protein
MVSQNQYNVLRNASDCYLSHDNFGIRDVEDVMDSVFGSNRTGDEATTWVCYWNELNMYEENLRTKNGGDAPMVCGLSAKFTKADSG